MTEPMTHTPPERPSIDERARDPATLAGTLVL